MVEFTHIQNDKAQMVDISAKGDVVREAVASGKIFLRPETLAAIREGTVVKGNVLATARVAATLAVKKTPDLIPMCHQIPISSISVILLRVRVYRSDGGREDDREDRSRDGGPDRSVGRFVDCLGHGEVRGEGCAGTVSGDRITDVRVVEKKKGK